MDKKNCPVKHIVWRIYNIGTVRAVKSNRFWFDFWGRSCRNLSILFKRFDSIQNCMNSHERKSTFFPLSFLPAGKWPFFKRIVHYGAIDIWQSLLRFCFVNCSFFFCRNLKFSLFRFFFFVKIESKWIQNWKVIWFDLDKIWFDLSKNIRFNNKIWFDSNLIWFDSPGNCAIKCHFLKGWFVVRSC